MRKVVYGGAVSLDQYLAREDGAVDWLIMDSEAMGLMAGMWDRFDVIVMGRKTFEKSMEQFSEEDLKKAAPTTPSSEADATPPQAGGEPTTGGMRSFVFSRTLEPGKKGGYEIVNEDAVEFVRRLKFADDRGASTTPPPEAGATPSNQGGESQKRPSEHKDICVMGGGELAASLFEAGLIDEVGFNIHPIVLGAGIPAFRPISRQVDLELVDSRAMKSGCVYVVYKVVNKQE
jgi:dihydrofolate reductase